MGVFFDCNGTKTGNHNRDGMKRMSKTEEHNTYQQDYYSQADHSRIFPAETPYVHRHVDHVLKAANISSGGRVLDVGAGMGRHALLMAQRGIRVVATDLSPVLIEELQTRSAGTGITSFVSDVHNISAGTDERFDFAVGYFMLHHLLDLESAFTGIRGVLKPGARIAFCEPNAYYVPFYAQIVLSRKMTWAGDRGIINMRPSKVFAAAAAAGFVNPRCTRFGFFPPALANNKIGRAFERVLEALPFLRPVRAFNVFSAEVPSEN